MKQIIEKYNFYHYSTQCYCVGGGKYYKNNDYPNLKILLKAGYGIIRVFGVEKYKTKNEIDFENKLQEFLK